MQLKREAAECGDEIKRCTDRKKSNQLVEQKQMDFFYGYRFLHACFSAVFAPYFDSNVFYVKNIINKIKMDIWAKYGPNLAIWPWDGEWDAALRRYLGSF